MQQKFTNKNCKFYFQGRCKFGNHCHFNHIGNTQIHIIRHAQSQYNMICAQQWQKNQDFSGQIAQKSFQMNSKLIDCSLSQQGYQQILTNKLPQDCYYKINQQKNVDIIFVSPLNRTLQTLDLLQKNNGLNIKEIIVLPQLTEVLSKICDFSDEIKTKIKKYPKYNFDYLINKYKGKQIQKWQDNLVEQQWLNKINQKKIYGKRYLNLLNEIFPIPLQNNKFCFQRVKYAMKIMKEIILKKNASKILVVTHNRILKYMTGMLNDGFGISMRNYEVKKLIY